MLLGYLVVKLYDCYNTTLKEVNIRDDHDKLWSNAINQTVCHINDPAKRKYQNGVPILG